MTQLEATSKHVQITEVFLRFYVLLSQYLDRCSDQAVRAAIPEGDFAMHLEDTRKKVEELFASNRIVPSKIHAEYEQVIEVGRVFIDSPSGESARSALEKERERLRIKSSVLSDLMAVFRSL